jgi:hypothetical protein
VTFRFRLKNGDFRGISAAAKAQPADPEDRPVRHSFELCVAIHAAAQADTRRPMESLDEELELLEKTACITHQYRICLRPRQAKRPRICERVAPVADLLCWADAVV